jgi:hypothetical protein
MKETIRTVAGALLLGVLAGWSAPAYADANDKPLASAMHSKGLIVEVMSIKFDDAKKLATITWRYRNATKQSIELLSASPRFQGSTARPVDRFLNAVYYLESNQQDVAAYRCSIVKDNGGKLWCSDLGRTAVVIKPGEQVEYWAKFPIPEAASKTISFHVLDTPLLENIPVPRR